MRGWTGQHKREACVRDCGGGGSRGLLMAGAVAGAARWHRPRRRLRCSCVQAPRSWCVSVGRGMVAIGWIALDCERWDGGGIISPKRVVAL